MTGNSGLYHIPHQNQVQKTAVQFEPAIKTICRLVVRPPRPATIGEYLKIASYMRGKQLHYSNHVARCDFCPPTNDSSTFEEAVSILKQNCSRYRCLNVDFALVLLYVSETPYYAESSEKR